MDNYTASVVRFCLPCMTVLVMGIMVDTWHIRLDTAEIRKGMDRVERSIGYLPPLTQVEQRQEPTRVD